MNLLTDILPANARKYVYAVITLAALVFGAWQASEGNIEVFIASLLAALTTGMATSNVDNANPGDYFDGHPEA